MNMPLPINKITFPIGTKIMNENFGGNKFESTELTTYVEFRTTPETELLSPSELYDLVKKDLIQLADIRLQDAKAAITGVSVTAAPPVKSPFANKFRKP